MIQVCYCGNIYEVIGIGDGGVELMDSSNGESIDVSYGTFLNECDSLDVMIDYKKVLPDSIFKKER